MEASQNSRLHQDDWSITIVPLEIKGLKNLYLELIFHGLKSSRSECEKLMELFAGPRYCIDGSIDINQF